ncbi:MAG: prolyl oligopeptidase family serine peptidase [Chitinophaga sp.]|uniref:alpha/beta hydrolase n=1 Tax=Chitinophaga sp. TaxID=1869181 RepID=UPI0025B99A22|nr:alpha/beta hydrolase-fold protein [Chitinophaga sp.]MBV8253055.1 prolyl oligopeptidase family serine peptidase [Chitinophaga sp.]
MKKSILILLFLLFGQLYSHAHEIIHSTVFSPSMHRKIPVIIITPDVVPQHRYPVVYILHGFSGNPDRILTQDLPTLPQLADQFQTIYVLPDGSYDCWYVNSPLVASSQYNTFVSSELVTAIDLQYPTIKDREHRGLLGWSMGGYGALHIGVSHPETFSIIGSTCGAVDFNYFGEGFGFYHVDKYLGKFADLDPKFMVVKQLDKMKSAHQSYFLDCGTEDTQMLEMNRHLHQLMTDNNINHQYTESPGKHDATYWSYALRIQLLFFNDILKTR